ncbi:unnamed protein product [Mytilus coruscus]|uniref:Ig-like domain-containing protein n=1 Tax=Mytilus coruscus TaxID=42192 RepID=A0A6J8CL95_MYTCO|nr:unnamed protein product [Mytilus coruscus]
MILILLELQYLLTNALDIHSNYYNTIGTFKFAQSVDAEGPLQVSRISCVNFCLSDNACVSISYSKVLKMCWKHNIDPVRHVDKIERDNNWEILYPGTVEFAPKVLNYTATVKITYNHRVNVSCIVIGNPYPRIDMMTTTTYHNIELTKTGLTVSSFGTEHDGHYRCLATNKHGTDELVFVLKGQP